MTFRIHLTGARRVFRAGAVEVFDGGSSQGAVVPLAGGAEVELAERGVRFDGLEGFEQSGDIDAIYGFGASHGGILSHIFLATLNKWPES